jgi:hypothetical protein
MPVSPEQRKILLERLEMARKAKAEKAEQPKIERKKKEIALPNAIESQPPAFEQPVAAVAPAPLPKTQDLQLEEPLKPKKNAKNKYMKVVFYSEPGKKKVENLLKSLEDDSSETVQETPKQKSQQRSSQKKAPVKKPKEDDSLDQLARLYFS